MANSTVAALSAASALAGTELFYADQSGDVKVTATQIKTFASASPTLVTPNIGTPSAGVLTSATGLPISTGLTGAGTGVLTALGVNVGSAGAPVLFNGAGGTPSSLTLTNATGLPVGSITGLGTGVATALAVNVGSAGAPVLFNGALGTPSSATLTNATGLPVGAITGLGTGVATALAVNVGSAGAPVVNGGALGTPSSGTLTSATGLPISTGVSGLGTGVATFLATPSSANLASALTDETGSGLAVFGTSPNFLTSVTLNTTTLLTFPAAATLQHGAADAASPVAQTLKFQGVVAGTSNTAGANATIAGSVGTGTGAGGSLIFQTAPAGSTGTSQNALVTALTIDSTKAATFAGIVVLPAGAAQAPGLQIGAQTQTGFYSNSSGQVTFTGANGNYATFGNGLGVQIAANVMFSWSNSAGTSNTTQDTFLSRPAAATIQLGTANAASPVAQTLQVQGSRSGTDSNVGGGALTIQPGLGTGTGTPSSLVLKGIVGTTTGTGTQAVSTAITVAGVATGQLPSVVVGSAAIATTATDGFLYIPSCAGTPTGVPTTFTGRVPMVYDTTNHKFYIYDGSWLGGTAPGVFS